MPDTFTPPPLDSLEPEDFQPPPPSSLEPLSKRGARRLRLTGEQAEAVAEGERLDDSSPLRRMVADPAISLAKGVIAVPETVVGLADLVSKGRAGKLAEDAGIKFRESKDILSSYLTAAQQEANRSVAAAAERETGLLDKFGAATKAALESPSTIGHTVVESIPSILSGAALGRVALGAAAKLGPRATALAAAPSAPLVAGAAGEGIVTAGQLAEGVRQQTPDRLLDWKQVGAALGAGILTGGIGLASGRLAKYLGLEDINTLMVRAGSQGASKTLSQRIGASLGGALTEGLLEELPQSAQEQIAQNLALGKPWKDGVAEAAAAGLLAGVATGGLVNAIAPGRPAPPATVAPPPPTQPIVTGRNLPLPQTIPASDDGTRLLAQEPPPIPGPEVVAAPPQVTTPAAPQAAPVVAPTVTAPPPVTTLVAPPSTPQTITGSNVQTGTEMPVQPTAQTMAGGAVPLEARLSLGEKRSPAQASLDLDYSSAVQGGDIAAAQRLIDEVNPIKLPPLAPQVESEIANRVNAANESDETFPRSGALIELLQDMDNRDSVAFTIKKELQDFGISVGIFKPNTLAQVQERKRNQIGRGKGYDFKRGDIYYVFDSWKPLGGLAEEGTYDDSGKVIPLSRRLRIADANLGRSLGSPLSGVQPSMSVRQVTEALYPFGFGGLPVNTEVAHRLDITFNGRGVRGWWNPSTRRIWLNAAYIKTAAEARAVFIEEAFHAVENDPKVAKEMKRLLDSLTQDQIADAMLVYGDDEVRARYEAVADILEKESLNEEQRDILDSLWIAIKDAITKLLGLVNPAWNTVETDARTIISNALRAAGQGRATNVGPLKPILAQNGFDLPAGTPRTTMDRMSLGAPLSQAEIQAAESLTPAPGEVAAAAESVAATGEQLYAGFERAERELEGLAYEKPEVKTAREDLRALTTLAADKIRQSASPNLALAPDPDAGVAKVPVRDAAGKVAGYRIEVTDAFTDGLTAQRIPHDKSRVKEQQARMFMEREAVKLVNMRRELASREELAAYYEAQPKPDLYADEITSLRRSIAQRRRNINELADTAHGDTTVGARADEIARAQDNELENRSKADALLVSQVEQIFGDDGVLALLQALIADPANVTTEVLNLRSLLGDSTQVDRLRNLPENQRQVAIVELGKLFRHFDANRETLQALRDAALKVLERKFKSLKPTLVEKQVERDNAENALLGILQAESVNPDTTTTIGVQAEMQELVKRSSAILELARRVGTNQQQNKALYDWIADGYQGTPPTNVSTTAGIEAQTLAMILDAAARSPRFGSALSALVRSAAEESQGFPAAKANELGTAIEAGDSAQVISVLESLNQNSNAGVTAARAIQHPAIKELVEFAVRLRSLDHALSLFTAARSSPEFSRLRGSIESDEGAFVVRQKIDNQERMTLKEFGKEGVTPSSKEVSMLPIGDDNFLIMHDDWRRRTVAWFIAARNYVMDYEEARQAHLDNPLANPNPEFLGFDAPTARGLQQALVSDMPMLLDFSNFNPLDRLQTHWLERLLQDNHVIGKIFRNPERVWGLIGGMMGANVRQAGGDLTAQEQKSNAIYHRFRNLDVLRGQALRSHDKDGVGRILETYRKLVWKELTHESRRFNSPVKVGYVLPKSRLVVTKEDMDLLRRTVEFGNAVRRELEEFRSDRGVVERIGGKEYVRKGASPGDNPLPRLLDHESQGRVNSLVTTTEGTSAADRAFDASTDLSQNSANPVVKFWNADMDALLSHILDSDRLDRSIKQDARMLAAEKALAADLRSGVTMPAKSLAELAQQIAAKVPPNTGFLAYDFAVKELGKELEQFRQEAAEIADTERRQAQNSGVQVIISSQNEYTKPAAQLRLPSSWYSYGALSDGERLFALKRATHEQAIQLVSSMAQAVEDIKAAVAYWNKLPISEHTDAKQKEVFKDYGNLVEAEQVQRILETELSDSVKKYQLATQAAQSKLGKIVKGGYRLVLSALLASPTVFINNAVSATVAIFGSHSIAGRLSSVAGFLAMARYLVRFTVKSGLMALKWVVRLGELGLDKAVIKWLGLPEGQRFLSDGIEGFAKNILGVDPWSDLSTVQRLGFSQRDLFWERLKRIRDEFSEYADAAEATEAKQKPIRTNLYRGTRVVGKTVQQFFIKGGIEMQDMTINVANLLGTHEKENDYKRFAMRYGAERERMGLKDFDFDDPRWKAHASEGFAHPLASTREKQLAMAREQFQQFSGSSGAQLEKSLWDYYQAQKTNPDAPFFTTDEQWDNFARKHLADTNATTKANRPSYAQANPDTAQLTMFWGYMTWLANSMAHHLAVNRGTKTGYAMAAQSGAIVATLLACTIAGMLAITGKEEWSRRFRGKTSKNPVLTDPDLWISPRAMATFAALGGASTLPALGSTAMMIQDMRSGGKGYDPSGIVVPLSLLSSFVNTVRGIAAVPFKHANIPLEDLAARMVPFSQELMKLTGLNRESRNATAVYNGWMREIGMPVERKGSGGGIPYGPTTKMRRGMDEAVQEMAKAQREGDSAGYQKALKRATENREELVAYYRDERKMTQEKAEAAAYRDYAELNPIRRAYQGKAITDEEYAKLDAAMGTSERSNQARAAVAAWQQGAQTLFGRAGSITKEETAANRPSSGGVSRASSYRRISMGSGPSTSFRAPRTSMPRYRRMALGTSRIRTPRFRSGLRAPRVRKFRPKRIRISA